jgi:hypothetical protein
MDAENVGDILDALAVRFGATGEMLWAALIRQAYVEAALWGLALPLTGVCLWAAVRWSIRDGGRSEPGPFMAVSVVAIATLFAIVGFMIALGSALNPEYYALSKILGAL